MDYILEELLEVRRQLHAELVASPLWRTLQEIERLIDLRYGRDLPVPVPSGRLLCEVVNEAKVDVWENEGGAIPNLLPPETEMPIPPSSSA